MNGVPWWFFEGFGGRACRDAPAIDRPGRQHRARPIPRSTSSAASCMRAARSPSPGFVQHHFGNKLIIGEPSGEKTARVLELAALLEKAGFETVLSEQIQKDVWYKLWGNMTMNPVSAITGATTDRILDDDAGARLHSAA